MGFDISDTIGNIQDFFSDLPDTISQWYQKSMAYFKSLSLYEMIAWGGNSLGLILVIVALVLW